MRKFIPLAILSILLAGATGCDTEQPTQTGEQNLEISFVASNMLAYQYDVWDQYYDANANGQPDAGETVERWCQQAWSTTVNPEPLTRTASSVPWPFSLEISVISAGETTPNVITTSQALSSDFNLTPFDDWVETFQPLPPTCSSDPDPLLICIPLGRVSGVNQLVADSDFYQDDIFQCPGTPGIPAPRLDGTEANPSLPPFTLSVQKGDTIIVKARKNTTAAGDLEFLTSQPALIAQISLDGRLISPQGDTSSTIEIGSGLSFSFTVQ